MQIDITNENRERLKSLLGEVGNAKLQSAKRRYERLEEVIRDTQQGLVSYYRDKKTVSDEIIKESKSHSEFAERLMTLTGIEKIERAYFDVDYKNVIVNTKELYFRTLNGGRYRLGKATIKLNVDDFDIRFDTDNKRRSYWGSGCPHPHVNTYGKACLGNTGELIASLQSEGEYGLIFDILIAFLEQANTADCAGQFAMNWDKVDEEGNIIQTGLVDADSSCFKYGNTPDEDKVVELGRCVCCEHVFNEDDEIIRDADGDLICEECCDEQYEYCSECGEWHMREDCVYIESAHGYVCDGCREEDYFYCEDCGEWEHTNNGSYVESLSRMVCNHCLGEDYTYCDTCDEYYKSQDVIYVESTEKDVCNECIKEYYSTCDKCGEYFLTEQLTENEASEVVCSDCAEESDNEVATTTSALPQVNDIELQEFIAQLQEETQRCCECGTEVTEDTKVVYANNVYCVPCGIERI